MIYSPPQRHTVPSCIPSLHLFELDFIYIGIGDPIIPIADLLLAKAEPISDSGSASVITYLRRGKKLLCNSSQSSE